MVELRKSFMAETMSVTKAKRTYKQTQKKLITSRENKILPCPKLRLLTRTHFGDCFFSKKRHHNKKVGISFCGPQFSGVITKEIVFQTKKFSKKINLVVIYAVFNIKLYPIKTKFSSHVFLFNFFFDSIFHVQVEQPTKTPRKFL